MGYTAVPDDFFALVERKCLSGATERDIILLVLKFTLGHPEKPETVELSAEQLARYCGFDTVTGVKNFELCLKSMASEERHILARKRKGRKFLYQALWDTWESVPAYDPSMMDRAKEEADEEATEPPAPALELVPKPVVVEPGKTSKPFKLPDVPKSEWLWRNECSAPLSVAAVLYDGQLIFVTKDGKSATKGETVTLPTGSLKKTKGLSVPPSDFPALRTLINEFSLPAFGKVVDSDPAILRKIDRSLKGAPLETFRQTIVGAKHRLTPEKTLGFFALLAHDASVAHAVALEVADKEGQDREAVERRMRIRTLGAALTRLERPLPVDAGRTKDGKPIPLTDGDREFDAALRRQDEEFVATATEDELAQAHEARKES